MRNQPLGGITAVHKVDFFLENVDSAQFGQSVGPFTIPAVRKIVKKE